LVTIRVKTNIKIKKNLLNWKFTRSVKDKYTHAQKDIATSYGRVCSTPPEGEGCKFLNQLYINTLMVLLIAFLVLKLTGYLSIGWFEIIFTAIVIKIIEDLVS